MEQSLITDSFYNKPFLTEALVICAVVDQTVLLLLLTCVRFECGGEETGFKVVSI